MKLALSIIALSSVIIVPAATAIESIDRQPSTIYLAQAATEKKGYTQYYLSAQKKFMNNDNKGALEDLNRAIKINPKYADAYSLRGLVFSLTGDTKSTLQDFQRAIELEPDMYGHYMFRASYYQKTENYKQAVPDLTKAIELKPNDGSLYNDRGFCYYKLGDNKTALVDLRKAAELYQQSGDTQKYQEVMNDVGTLQMKEQYNIKK